MHRMCTAIVLVFTVCAAAPAANAADDCARLEQQILSVEQQMGRSHTAAQGNRLRARLRGLRERVAHDCR